jgi:hypothetical protein
VSTSAYVVLLRPGVVRGFAQVCFQAKKGAISWASDFGLAELLTLAVVLVGAYCAQLGTEKKFLIAMAGDAGEYFAFYCGLILQRVINSGRESQIQANKKTVIRFFALETVDFIVRPLIMTAMLYLAGELICGIIFGKLAADSIFYYLFYSFKRLSGHC